MRLLMGLAAAGHIGAVALNAVTLLVRLVTDALDYAALGVFFRFQIPGFDLSFGFFSLCHFIFLAIYFGLFVVVLVSDTEEHLMPALNVLFWNQVVEANQFISCALAPLIS